MKNAESQNNIIGEYDGQNRFHCFCCGSIGTVATSNDINLVAKLREKAAEVLLVGVAWGYTTLKLLGIPSYNGKCPLCKVEPPSLYIDYHDNTFYCTNCRKNGDTVEFLASVENISYMKAIQKLLNLSFIDEDNTKTN